jgi:hypothetical protein
MNNIRLNSEKVKKKILKKKKTIIKINKKKLFNTNYKEN